MSGKEEVGGCTRGLEGLKRGRGEIYGRDGLDLGWMGMGWCWCWVQGRKRDMGTCRFARRDPGGVSVLDVN